MTETTKPARQTKPVTRVLSVGLGIGAVALALWAVGRWNGFAPWSINQLLLIIFGVLLIVIGVLGDRLPASGLLKGYQGLALVLFNTLLFVLTLEMLATIALNVKTDLTPGAREAPDSYEDWARISYYAEQPWGVNFWKEYATNHTVYQPYVVWRKAPFTGEQINVDKRGIRVTPGAVCDDANAYRVYAFGGSTMWGFGSPDWGSIPAYLQEMLPEMVDRPVCVVNYAEDAYVSTQGVITLMRLLQAGDVPDLALFYDGLNDTYAAYQSGIAGVHQNVSLVASNMERNALSDAALDTLRQTSLFTFVRGLLRISPPATDYVSQGISAETMTDETIRAYLANCDFVAALAEIYGFEYAMFWQPSPLIGDKPLTDEERAVRSTIDPKWAALLEQSYARIAQETAQRDDLYYIADVFDAETRTIWIDWHHVIPEGNAMIAARMLELLRPQIVRSEVGS